MTSRPSEEPRLKGTDLLHADDELHGPEVAPPISVTTIFRYPVPADENDLLRERGFDPYSASSHVYSRYTQPVSSRAERVLGKINDGYATTFASGLAAAFAALAFLQPKRVAILDGYVGCHQTIEVFKRCRGGELPVISIEDDFQPGDLVWVETPLNPTGESRNIKYYADKVHAAGGRLLVDSTFAPPPLQYPFKWGTDVILHSGSKYFGGHSDLLCGALIVKTKAEWDELWQIRTFLGSMMGSMESWLLLRSLRTLHLRIVRQSQNATELVRWLNNAAGGKSYDGIPEGVIDKVFHSSVQGKDANGWEPSEQMEGGWNAVFAFNLSKVEYAAFLPHTLKYFTPATSLGAVESLVEQRAQVDSTQDRRLIRISVGVEDVEDLKDDMRSALQEIVKPREKA